MSRISHQGSPPDWRFEPADASDALSSPPVNGRLKSSSVGVLVGVFVAPPPVSASVSSDVLDVEACTSVAVAEGSAVPVETLPVKGRLNKAVLVGVLVASASCEPVAGVLVGEGVNVGVMVGVSVGIGDGV
jgi:hypothetical protein